MPTKQPRIAITLNPHTREVFKRLSELQGVPLSRVVADLLESVAEPMRRTVAFLEAAAEAPKQVRDGLKSSAERIERELYGAAGYGLSQIDWLIDEVGKGGEEGGDALSARPPSTPPKAVPRKSSRKESAKHANPPVVTRGSGTPPVPPSRAPKTARKPVTARVSGKGGRRG